MKITETHVFFWDGPFSQWYTSNFYEDGYLQVIFKDGEMFFDTDFAAIRARGSL